MPSAARAIAERLVGVPYARFVGMRLEGAESTGIFVNTVALTARTSGRPVATGSVTYRIGRPDA